MKKRFNNQKNNQKMKFRFYDKNLRMKSSI